VIAARVNVALALTLFVQSQPVTDPVRWTIVDAARQSVEHGAVVKVKLAAAIEPGWHLYSIDQPPGGPIPTEISLPPGQPFAFAKPIVGPKPHTIFDQNFGMRVQLYTRSAEFILPIKVAATAPHGTQTLTVQTRYQACNDQICLPPRIANPTLAVAIK